MRCGEVVRHAASYQSARQGVGANIRALFAGMHDDEAVIYQAAGEARASSVRLATVAAKIGQMP